ncbi:MAG: ABC transporter ATP-binding protein [Clostridiales bacterium]
MKIIREYILLFKDYYIKAIIMGIFIFFYSCISVIMPYLYKQIIDEGLLKEQQNKIIYSVIIIVFLLLLQEIIYIIQVKISLDVRKDMFIKIKLKMYNKLLRMSQNFYSKTHTGKLITRFTSDIDNLQNLLLEKFVYFAKDIFIAILIIIVLLFINWKIVAISFAFIPILFLLYKFFNNKISLFSYILQEKEELLIEKLKDDFLFVQAIQLFSPYAKKVKKNYTIFKELEIAKNNLSYQYTKSASATVIISIVGILIIWGYGGYEVLKNEISLGTLIALSFYLNYVQNIFITTYYTIIGIKSSIPSLKRIMEILNLETNFVDENDGIDYKINEGDIILKDATFAYENNKNILDNANCTIKNNRITALIGDSGVGKTTLINIIGRFYKLEKGSITLNDIDINKISINSFYKIFSIVPQEFLLFNISIKDNIIMDRENITNLQFKNIVEYLGIDKIAKKFDEEYNKIIGESGRILSAGERKRILIARAIIENPYILVFDEATSQLDAESEKNILNLIKKISKERIVIFITHNEMNLKFAEDVIILDKGKLIQKSKIRQIN